VTARRFAAAIALLLALACAAAPRPAPPQTPLRPIDDLASLFDAGRGYPRLLASFSPT
jgi:hypothetical protein